MCKSREKIMVPTFEAGFCETIGGSCGLQTWIVICVCHMVIFGVVVIVLGVS